MHWGIRRYQPYSSNPRKGGASGKFISAKKAKKLNEWRKKQIYKTKKKYDKWDKTLQRNITSSKYRAEKFTNKGKTDKAKIEREDIKNTEKYRKVNADLKAAEINKIKKMSLSEVSQAKKDKGKYYVKQAAKIGGAVLGSAALTSAIGVGAGLVAGKAAGVPLAISAHGARTIPIGLGAIPFSTSAASKASMLTAIGLSSGVSNSRQMSGKNNQQRGFLTQKEVNKVYKKNNFTPNTPAKKTSTTKKTSSGAMKVERDNLGRVTSIGGKVEIGPNGKVGMYDSNGQFRSLSEIHSGLASGEYNKKKRK